MPQPSAASATMPQELRGFKDYDDGPDALLRRPELAVMVALVAARWTRIEEELARLFVAHLGGEEEMALAIYLELRDRGLREVAAKAVLRSKLVPEMHKTLEKLFKRARRCASDRADVVHGYWAVSDSYPDAILLIDNAHRQRLNLQYRDFLMFHPTAAQGLTAELADYKVWIYRGPQFEAILARMTELEADLRGFLSDQAKFPRRHG